MPRTRTSEAAQALIGSVVRRARDERHLTQRELAAALEVHPSYVANLERGRVNLTIGQLANIAETLNMGLELNLPPLPEGPIRIAAGR